MILLLPHESGLYHHSKIIIKSDIYSHNGSKEQIHNLFLLASSLYIKKHHQQQQKKKKKGKKRKKIFIFSSKLHGPSMFAVRAKIYGVLYNQASSIAFDETFSYWSALKRS